MGVQRSGLVRGSRCSSWGYSEHTLKEQFIEKWSYYIPTPVQMKKRLTPVVIKTFLELHRRQSTEAQRNGVIWCLFSGLCFRFIKQVPNYFSCWGESCNSVLPWSPRNVLWAKKLQPTLHQHGTWVDNDRMYIFGWTFSLWAHSHRETSLSRNVFKD